MFLEGCGIDYPFMGTPHTPRVWNGRIHYCFTPLGIEEATLTTVGSSVFPNPFDDYAIIKIEGITPKEYSLKVFDMLGKMVNEIKDISSNEIKIEKGKFTSGIYFYQLYSLKGIAGNGKFIVQ